MEFRSKRLQEIKDIQGSRKTKPSEKGDRVKGAKRVGDLGHDAQAIMFVMRASLFHTYVTRAAWYEAEAVSLERAKNFAKEHMSDDLSVLIDDDELMKTFKLGLSQIRSTGAPTIQDKVQLFYSLEQGDVQTAKWLCERDRFLYPATNMEHDDMFNIEIISTVLEILYFGTGSRRIGILFMDKMLEEDDPDYIAELLTRVALIGQDGAPEIPTVVDRSRDASRGPSIASIAFAAVHVYRALERLQLPEVDQSDKKKKKQGGLWKKDFNVDNYNDLWMHYVRELAAHKNLGQLRRGFLDRIQ
ncbi:hypothetical protein BDV93DRAFT_560240 [Ceratobasidium sp. AG-I]|nr:hypothetical protein BDV93DRAFT_560240 [Ceratobasidium sp. AG-I]